MSKSKILVADNDPGFRESLVKWVLEPEGYDVIQADSPESAKRVLSEQLIHLAIVDVRLINDDDPNDKSGIDLCEKIEPMIARIVLTGFPDDWKLVRSFGRPTNNRHRLADEFVAKQEPEYQDRLLAVIARALDAEFEIIPERRFAVLTSGGDSPGMNAAIWAVVRAAMANGTEVVGVHDGYRGLVENSMHKLRWNEVSSIMGLSGTILGTARLDEFKDPKARRQAVDNILAKYISGLIVAGGDGSMQGAQALSRDIRDAGGDLRVVALPGTIDNDLWGTDMTLGAATATDAMVQNLRNMSASAQALRRIYVGEVMGACSGYLALQAALGIGADAVFIPETSVEVLSPSDASDPRRWRERIDRNGTEDCLREQLVEVTKQLEVLFKRGKRCGFVVVAEGIKKLTDEPLDASYVQNYLANAVKNWPQQYRPDVRPHILGYPVRGVPPGSFDVWLGARLGAAAVQCLLDGKSNVMVGWSEERGVIETPFDEVVAKSNRAPREIWADRPKWRELLELQQTLAYPPSSPESHDMLRAQGNHFVR